MTFASNQAYQNHMIGCKERNKNKICDFCGKNFNELRDKLRHEQSVHDMNRSFVCSYCPVRAFSAGALKIHVARSHKGLTNRGTK